MEKPKALVKKAGANPNYKGDKKKQRRGDKYKSDITNCHQSVEDASYCHVRLSIRTQYFSV